HPDPDPAPQPRQKRTTTKDHSSPGPLYGPDLLMPTIGAHPTTRSSPDPSTPSPREQSPLLTPAHPVTPTLPICPPPHRLGCVKKCEQSLVFFCVVTLPEGQRRLGVYPRPVPGCGNRVQSGV